MNFGSSSPLGNALSYPKARPQYDLNFIRNKFIPPEYTFTRNSPGTYVGADGYIKTAATNEPRFDYDPITGEFKGLLVEESRTNYQKTDIPTNIIQASIESTTELAPNGTNTAIKLLVNSTAGEAVQWDSSSAAATGSVVTGEYFSISYWLKGTDGDQWIFSPKRNGGNVWQFPITHTITSKWTRYFQRIQIPFEGATAIILRILGPAPSNSIYIWGMQVERGDFSTSYIPTSGSAVTRQPDQLVLNRPFNSLGTFFVESNQTRGTTLSADNGTSNILMSSTGKEALYYNTNRTLRMSSDSIPSLINTTRPPQNLNRVSLGHNALQNSQYINGHLKKFMYYGSPVTEDNLRSLTGNTLDTFRSNDGAIVTNGLVLNLDAGNRASYPGSGTTWFDLSGNGNNGTLVNGVGYNSANGGSLSFDGVDDLVDINNFSITPEYTINIFIKFLSSISGFRAIVDFGNLINAVRLYLNNDLIKIQHAIPFAATGVLSTFTPTVGIYYNITTTFTGGNSKLYFNSILNSSGSLDPHSTSPTRLGIADHPIGSSSIIAQLNCDIPIIQIYNRALTPQEIQQNFNATRSRFGI